MPGLTPPQPVAIRVVPKASCRRLALRPPTSPSHGCPAGIAARPCYPPPGSQYGRLGSPGTCPAARPWLQPNHPPMCAPQRNGAAHPFPPQWPSLSSTDSAVSAALLPKPPQAPGRQAAPVDSSPIVGSSVRLLLAALLAAAVLLRDWRH
ncbi:uncharacterized protein LOC126188742 [Schistocerca cancellata]|uniref:uncharacterized protein LOC126188742 n=1 Tax=Schistocerca cancellata TaxID=274614 RepID=UPI002119346F|nr:uncharacterized protein LOC126188742 [Schistocerca cancellata]